MIVGIRSGGLIERAIAPDIHYRVALTHHSGFKLHGHPQRIANRVSKQNTPTGTNYLHVKREYIQKNLPTMENNGTYLKTSFANFNPSHYANPLLGINDNPPSYFGEPKQITDLYLYQFRCLPLGSSELVYLGNEGTTLIIGFAGIPKYGVMLRLLAIMENDVFPQSGCQLDVHFNFQQDDAIILQGVNPHYIPNCNTYTDILQFVERCQHHVY